MHIDSQYLAYALTPGPIDAPWPGPLRLFTVDIGLLYLPTGRLVACDLLACPELEPFSVALPIGRYPVSLQVADLGGDQRVAFACIRFTEDFPASWQLLARPGQDLASLEEDEDFGYPVDAGTGAFMDASTNRFLLQRYRHDSTYSDTIISAMRDKYVDTWDWAELAPEPTDQGNIFAFHSGFGDGSYPTFLGRSSGGAAAAVVTDFMVFERPDAGDGTRVA
jgi:hypothetical protein